MSDKYKPARFTISLLHPKYWGVWLGFGMLALLVNLLPYLILRQLGFSLGELAMRFAQKRVHIARRNLELAFPDKAEQEVEAIVLQNFRNTGFAFFEMGITWFWPTWRLKRRLKTINFEQIADYQKQKRGMLVCHPHTLNLEISARAFAILGYSGYGVYRPHNNPAYDFIQCWGRTHNGNKVIDRKDLKKMIRELKNGERLFYLGDHDYGRKKSVFVPFFAVKDACTVTGANILYKASNCAMVPASGFRDDDGIYTIDLEPPIDIDFPDDDTEGAIVMNQAYERVILKQVDQWMWLHKRYKTMQDESQPKGIRYK